jgi:hypothetical protein
MVGAESVAEVTGALHPAGGNGCGDPVVDEDRPWCRRRLAPRQRAAHRPGRDQRATRRSDEEVILCPAGDADGDLHAGSAGWCRDASFARQEAEDARSSDGGVLLVSGACEQQHHRVAAELEDVPAAAAHDVDQAREDDVEDVDDVLRAGSPEAASRSVSVVNRETSKNASDPSIATCPPSGNDDRSSSAQSET